MSRGTWLAVMAGLICVGAAAITAAGAASEPELRPTPPRVYSSCLAADTKATAAGDDPCDGR
ncbi:hypothetical protein [Streptomyces lancefieldiae]|uniref:Uncharacterized protein n=1 Tax=Streptomyces lancefieldiae TaxID=3075520 RepID=A0ABU3B3N4_9ACTN|nr:hypothetical protein [Streptomyces sp. DSM 40712]MDT0615913.1 hypothetical protein [Streptomyces sp. DSM 40712]